MQRNADGWLGEVTPILRGLEEQGSPEPGQLTSGSLRPPDTPRLDAPFGRLPSPSGRTTVAGCDEPQRWVSSARETWVLRDRCHGGLDAGRVTANADVLNVAEPLHLA